MPNKEEYGGRGRGGFIMPQAVWISYKRKDNFNKSN